MDGSGRRQVDLFRLPGWARVLVFVATVLVVAGAALWWGRPESSPVVPLSAIVAGVIAFGYVAWRGRRRP